MKMIAECEGQTLYILDGEDPKNLDARGILVDKETGDKLDVIIHEILKVGDWSICHAQSMEPWIEWKKTCAIAACKNPEHVDYLTQYGVTHFLSYISRIIPEFQRYPFNKQRDYWHLFETYLVAGEAGHEQPGGKHYKNWLFERINTCKIGKPVEIIESGAALLMRDVVRKYANNEVCRGISSRQAEKHRLKKEHLQSGGTAGDPKDPSNKIQLIKEESFNAPLGTDKTFTLADVYSKARQAADMLLLDEVVVRDYQRLGSEMAPGIFKNMPSRERVIILASALELSLYHQNVLKAAGCGRAMVYKALNNFEIKIKHDIAKKYDPGDVEFLYYFTLLLLNEQCIEWGKKKEVEKLCAPLFTLAKEI